jgi:hypothetical protein
MTFNKSNKPPNSEKGDRRSRALQRIGARGGKTPERRENGKG